MADTLEMDTIVSQSLPEKSSNGGLFDQAFRHTPAMKAAAAVAAGATIEAKDHYVSLAVDAGIGVAITAAIDKIGLSSKTTTKVGLAAVGLSLAYYEISEGAQIARKEGISAIPQHMLAAFRSATKTIDTELHPALYSKNELAAADANLGSLGATGIHFVAGLSGVPLKMLGSEMFSLARNFSGRLSTGWTASGADVGSGTAQGVKLVAAGSSHFTFKGLSSALAGLIKTDHFFPQQWQSHHLTLRRMPESGKTVEVDRGSEGTEQSRAYPHPEQIITKREKVIDAQVKALYEGSFPAEERQATEEVQSLIDSGQIRLDVTRDPEGNVMAYSFVSIHDLGALKFAHLDFIAVQPGGRSQGVGTEHFKRLVQNLQHDNPEYAGMSLEMEDPNAPGLSAEEKSARQFRSKFYERLGARNELPGYADGDGHYVAPYHIVDFERIEEPGYAAQDQPAEWRVYWFQRHGQAPLLQSQRAETAAHMALQFYQDQSGYDLAADHAAVAALTRRLNARPTP
jgi:GNAT superfamily N-acetyltransferase